MPTYSLAVADGVLFVCLPDGADLAGAIRQETCTAYGAGIELEIARGLVLTDALAPGDEVVWQDGPGGELLDDRGTRYRYAVRREAGRARTAH
ncbi:hypothetical protein [Methylobacterium sp. A54F]